MSEIYIYGEIVDEAFGETEVSGKSFVDELKAASDPVTVRINSPGGSVFAALAIANAIKARGSVTVAIDGLCASAATLVACAASKVQMASNALMMFHPPRTMLFGHYNREDLLRFSTTLEKVEQSINATYQSKVADFKLEGELWLTASEAKEMGFADEITEATELEMFLRGLKDKKTPAPQMKADPAADVAEKILALIRDQLQSGSQNVTGGQVTDSDIKKAQADLIVKFANGLT